MNKYLRSLISNLRRKLRTLFTLLSIVRGLRALRLLVAIRDAFACGVEVAGPGPAGVDQQGQHHPAVPDAYRRDRAGAGGQGGHHASWFGGIYQDASKNFQSAASSR